MKNDFRQWLKKFRRWISRLFGKSAPSRGRSGILATRESVFVRLLLLEADYEDHEVSRIRSWRCVFRSPEAKHDILIACDRLKRRGSYGLKLSATHRYAVFRVARMAVGKKIRSDCLLIADLDCVGFQMTSRGLDGFAPQIADSLAVQLIKRNQQELDSLVKFEDEVGEEIPGERMNVQARWVKILRAYHTEYFPISGLY